MTARGDARPGAADVFGRGRSTAQRRAVAEAVAAMDVAFTADDLTGTLRTSRPAVSTATVYRSIAAMAESGFVAPVGERDGAVLYARCDRDGHHHHVVCTSCGATAHASCPLDGAGPGGFAPDGFVVTSHEVRLYGLCAACAAKTGG